MRIYRLCNEEGAETILKTRRSENIGHEYEAYDFQRLRQQIEAILQEDNIVETINNHMKEILMLIPEIEPMIGFDHKHPHHYLDVWQHTLEVIKNLRYQRFRVKYGSTIT